MGCIKTLLGTRDKESTLTSDTTGEKEKYKNVQDSAGGIGMIKSTRLYWGIGVE